MVLALSLVLLAACGGGDDAATSTCMPGAMSVPSSPGDPCKQDSPPCLAINGQGIATCGADGVWGQCVCQAPMAAGPATGTTIGTTATLCGNGQIDPGEDCEQGNTRGISCESMLGAGATGLVMCVSCKIDMSQCMAAAPVATPPMSTGGTGSLGAGGAGH